MIKKTLIIVCYDDVRYPPDLFLLEGDYRKFNKTIINQARQNSAEREKENALAKLLYDSDGEHIHPTVLLEEIINNENTIDMAIIWVWEMLNG
ncbi:MAG: hypothetical protein IPM51_11720 [Sphingobacteriaceae bacterium]|nr:hypothetical protein [Sphingobacteriaceae bacterium]